LLLGNLRISENAMRRVPLGIPLAIAWMLLTSCSRERHLVTRDPARREQLSAKMEAMYEQIKKQEPTWPPFTPPRKE